MDAKAIAAHNYLEHMLLDENVKPTMLPLSLLEAITNNFSHDREIGRGGFAVVYKGMLGNDMVAVKKLSQTLDMDEKKFIQEVQCLMKARHKNIVRFLGYCADTQGEMTDYEGKSVLAEVRNRLLCFEFVPNGSLSELINDASCGLEWRVRYQIFKGICEGLHYLHKNRIVHLDLKPGNILLDGNMVPKIADFGLSRCFDENQSKAITSKLIGSVGYVAPEFYDGLITFKLDMYSLGVIVMEMLTGKKGYSSVDKVLESWRNRLEMGQQDTPLYQVRLCFDIGLMCIDPNPENRPVTQYIMDKLRELESSYDFIDDFHSVNNDAFSLNGLEDSHQIKEDAVANKEPTVVVNDTENPILYPERPMPDGVSIKEHEQQIQQAGDISHETYEKPVLRLERESTTKGNWLQQLGIGSRLQRMYKSVARQSPSQGVEGLGSTEEEETKPMIRSNSLKRLVSYSSSKRHEELEEEDEDGVPVAATSSSVARRAGNDASTARLIWKPPSPVVEAVPALPEEAANLAVGVVDAERAVAAATGNRKWAPADVQVNSAAEQEPRSGGVWKEVEAKPRIRDVPNGVQWEHVAAGWPIWLTEVAAEVVRGWQPRRAESFEKLDKIGQGTFSSVYKARDLENGKIVALKKVRLANMDPESVRFMAREIHILRRLDHPNVIKLEGLVTSRMSSSLYLVFEYMEHDLAGLAATPGLKFSEPQVKCYMQQLLSGLDHCHNRGVLHRDIKGADLLLDNNGILKIADFGLATFFNPNQKQNLTSRVVTLWYRPPELLLGATNYGAAIDLWSAGCVLAELLSGKPIMPGRTEVEQLHKIFKLCGSPSEEFWANLKLSRATIFKPQHPYRRCVNDVYKDFPTTALTLLDHLLAVEPGNRGTAASALDSEFFTTKPYACDPSSLPKYPPSKEYDAKLRDEEARRQRAAAKGKEAEAGRRKQLPAPDGNSGLQHRRVQVNPKSSSYKFTPKEDAVSGFPIDPLARAADNGYPQRVPLMQAGRSSSTLGRSSGMDPKAQRFHTSQIITAEMSNQSTASGQRGNAPKMSNLGESARRQYLREHRSSSRYSQLTSADPSDRSEWNHQFQERPSSSHRKDDAAANKEPTVVNGTKKNRIHYSGPLMPPGVNMDEILREHERQIQQAVRRARLDKGKGKHNGERDQSEALLYTTGNVRADR